MKKRLLLYTIVFLAWLTPLYFYNHQLFFAINGFGDNLVGYPMLFLTSIADGFFVLMFLVLLYKYRDSEYMAGFFGFFVAGIIVQTIKTLYPLPRPLGLFGEEKVFVMGMKLSSRTFPSGHSATAMVLFRYLIGTAATNKPGLLAFKVLLAVLGLFTALSRVSVGAHFPLDVWCGAFVGLVTYEVVLGLVRRRQQKSKGWRYRTTATYGWGIFVVIIYLTVYKEKTYELTFILTPIVVLMGLYFLYMAIRSFVRESLWSSRT